MFLGRFLFRCFMFIISFGFLFNIVILVRWFILGFWFVDVLSVSLVYIVFMMWGGILELLRFENLWRKFFFI